MNILERVSETIEELLAVQMLLYHNKNWLAGDNKTINEEIQRKLKQLLIDINRYQKEKP